MDAAPLKPDSPLPTRPAAQVTASASLALLPGALVAPFPPVRDLWLQHAPWDRRGEERLREGVLARALADPATLVCETTSQHARLESTGTGLAWRPAMPEQASPGVVTVWLGGSPCRLVRVLDEPREGELWTPWREAVAGLGVDDAEALAVGLSIGRWHALHPFCSCCGTATHVAAAGWLRHCPACHAEHYPRTDPVVIMAVLDADDRICLARGHQWVSPFGMSCVAGFVDSAESLEDAVRREVWEELGLRVTGVAYAGSQPWPAAGQLMVAMVARVAAAELHIDPGEVAAARWFTRKELRAALAAGELSLPAAFAAGRWLVEAWLGERVDEAHSTVYIRAPM